MAVLYELLAGARGRAIRDANARRRSRSPHEPRSPLDRAPVAAGRRCSSAARTCSTRARGSTPRATSLVRDGAIAEIGAPGALAAPEGAEIIDGTAATCSRASSTRTCTCARPARSTRRTSTPARAPAAAGGYCAVVAMPNTDPDRRRRLGAARPARPAAARGTRARRLHGRGHPRAAGRGAHRDGRAPRRRRARLHRRRQARPPRGMLRRALHYQRLCGGVLALHEEDPSLSGTAVCTKARSARVSG